MAELVYALVSGASESNLLGVRVPFRAQRKNQLIKKPLNCERFFYDSLKIVPHF